LDGKGMTEPEEERSEQATIIFKKKGRKERKKSPSIHQRFLFNRGEAYHLSLGGGGVGVGAAAATATR